MMTINVDKAIATINRIAGRAIDNQPVMDLIALRQEAAVQDRILAGKDTPDHEPWAPWRPRTLSERTAKNNLAQGLLWDTGDLLHSIESHSTTGHAQIGTNTAYAPELQYGRWDMEPRPFIGWSEEGKTEAEALIISYLAEGAL